MNLLNQIDVMLEKRHSLFKLELTTNMLWTQGTDPTEIFNMSCHKKKKPFL
jgi:hypothetical protein